MAIQLSDYNNLQASVARVLGLGDTTYGYGQNVTSAQLPVNSVITSDQWTNVRNDLVNCVLYQNGGNTTGLTTVLPIITQNAPITTAILTKFQNAANTVTVNRNLVIVPSSPYPQGTRASLVTNGTYTSWNSLITETITVQFASGSKTAGTGTYTYTADDAARFYFNSGSVIEFGASLTGSNGTLKDNSWSTLFSAMGTVRFGLTATIGSAITSAIGYNNLTTSDQIAFVQSTTGTYIDSYQIKARKGTTGQVIFTVTLNDSTGLISGVDDFVTGTTTTTCQSYRATGYVTLPAPTATKGGSVVNGPTYALTANAPGIVNQGSNQAFTVTTTNVSNGTTLYWTTNLASTKGSTQGTVTITGNSGTITVATLLDYSTTATTYTVSLRVGGYTDQVIASATANIRAATPTYSISPDKTNMTENSDTVTFTFTTSAVPNGTSLFWKTNAVPGYNSIDAPDFVSIPSSYITINNNTANFALTTVADYIPEGTEAFTVSVHLSLGSPVLATSAVVYISDTSTNSGSITPNKTTMKMGDTVTFSIATQGVTGTLYWGLLGTASASRSASGTSGSVTIGGSLSAGIGSVSITVATDAATHNSEYFYMQLYTDAARTTAFGSASANVTISANGSQLFTSYTLWTVPAGVTQISTIIYGARGGSGSYDDTKSGIAGFYGSKVTGSFSTTGGTQYHLCIGSAGSNGWSGGGTGGGAGGVFLTDAAGGKGGNAGPVNYSGGGGGGGSPSGIFTGTIPNLTPIAVAGGGGGGAGAGYAGGNGPQVTGYSTGHAGAAGTNAPNDGGGGGGGGGGYPVGGAGGGIAGGDGTGTSGNTGQSMVPAGGTLFTQYTITATAGKVIPSTPSTTLNVTAGASNIQIGHTGIYKNTLTAATTTFTIVGGSGSTWTMDKAIVIGAFIIGGGQSVLMTPLQPPSVYLAWS